MTSRVEAQATHERIRNAEMHWARGMYAPAREEYAALLETSSNLSAEEIGLLAWRLAYCLVMLGETTEADRRIDETLRLENLPDVFRWRLKAVRACASHARGDYLDARTQASEAVEHLKTLADGPGLSSALRWLAVIHLRMGDLEPAFERAYCALAEARHAGIEAEVAHAHSVLAAAFIQRAQYDASRKHASEALGISERLSHQSAIVRNLLHLSIASRLAGSLEEAAKFANRALASAEESETTNLKISARLAFGRALRELGKIEAARETLEGAAQLAERSERDRDRILVLEDLGDLEATNGNLRVALAKYRKALQKADGIAANGDLVAELGWRVGAMMVELGDLDQALPWIERSITVGERSGERKEVALALRARAILHARSGNDDEARRDIADATLRLEALCTPCELARTHLAMDTVLECSANDSANTREERVRHLTIARELFERCGAAGALRATEQAIFRATRAATIGDATRGVRGSSRGMSVLETDWKSPSFLYTLEECRKLGPSSLPLLLAGESGTGKTLVAEALHELGRGREGGFFAVNCAALPENLQESELFGHRKGSFTGADRDHPGIFREAGRGTVFLDEIDKTTLTFQAKLLQVLDTHEVRPVGSTRLVPVEARIIGATNRNLEGLVAEGRFLEDLHHRLTAGKISVPPLRRRLEDLRILVGILLEEVCSLEKMSVPKISEDGWEALASHDWPGNVRELKSLLHRAVALHPQVPVLDARAIIHSAPEGSALKKRVEVKPVSDLWNRMAHTEREEILRALAKAGGVRRKAAEILGVSYRGLGKKMARLGITPDAARDR